jgi:phage terminase large subunit
VADFKLVYDPRKQFVPLHQRQLRWAALVCHRRAGKTVACVNELVIRAVYSNKDAPRYAYIAPYYRQAKDIAWVYLKEAVKGLAIETRESELRVVLPNGAWITLYGADNPDALRGIYLDGVVLDEYGDCRPSLWEEVILPTLADRKGWAIFIGTPKGKNHFYKIHQKYQKDANAYSLVLKASESGIIDPEELLLMKDQMEESKFQQEFECDFEAAVKGTYYAEMIKDMEVRGDIAPKPDLYDPAHPVSAAMDLGRKDSTAIWWFQDHGDTVNIIDYEEFQGKIISDMFEVFHGKPYKLHKLWVPHDAKAKTVQTRRSSIEQFLDAGFPADLVPKLGIQQGIDAVRMLLPQCRFDLSRTHHGVESLRAYKREYNELLKVFRDTPLHDWASDGADGFRYLALVARQIRAKIPEPEVLPVFKPAEYRLDDLFKANEKPVLSLVRRRI